MRSEQSVCPASVHPEAEDTTGFFNPAEDPEWAERSLYWSNFVHADPSVENVRNSLRRAHQDIKQALPGNLSETKAELLTCEAVRAMMTRAVGHYLAVELAPTVTALVEGDDTPVEAMLHDPSFSIVRPRDAAIVTDFNRVWYGDDARLIVATGLLLTETVENAIRNRRLPYGIELGYACATLWSAGLGQQQAREQGIAIDRRPEEYFVISGAEERGRWAERAFHSGLALGGRRLLDFLRQNVLTAAEHTSAWQIDVLHGFIPHPQATPDDYVRAVIAGQHGTSVAAYMPNVINARAEYENRYVRAESPTEGAYGSLRDPMVLVEANGQQYDIVRNPDSAYANASRRLRNKCPAPDALTPLGGEIEVFESLRAAMKKAIAPTYDGPTLTRLDRPYTYPDVVTGLGATVARSMIARGIVTFDGAEVQRHLGGPETATSTGEYILRRPR